MRLLALAAALLMVFALPATHTHDTAPGPGAVTVQAKPAFQPGFIISDDSFYNDKSMTAAHLQVFLESTPCHPADESPCLADYREDTVTQPVQFDHCARYPGADSERASTIISKVATACGINPQVLLVLLQKEQSLVTRPSAYGYQRATGYACPDTAGCDEKYFGFFNQVYNAAWQFREYGASEDWRYHVGKVQVQYSPKSECGSSVVVIRNQATANLYNYTPYQPNAATKAHPKAPATECSTYGNLNFFHIYNEWFGDPRAVRMPDWWGDCLVHIDGSECPSDPTALSIP